MPNDNQRINEIMQLVDEGHLNQILISQDVFVKSQRCCYGGWGYAHILNNTLPVMWAKGVAREVVHAIMVENPKRLLTFV
jgi:phosphotriesterase-related protein